MEMKDSSVLDHCGVQVCSNDDDKSTLSVNQSTSPPQSCTGTDESTSLQSEVLVLKQQLNDTKAQLLNVKEINKQLVEQIDALKAKSCDNVSGHLTSSMMIPC